MCLLAVPRCSGLAAPLSSWGLPGVCEALHARACIASLALYAHVRPDRHEEDAMKTLEDVQTWRGMTMVDPDGDKIGTIEDIFLDRQTGEPEWAAVKTGLFGLKSSFVPIRDAEVIGENEVRVPYQKEQIKDAPRVDDGELTPEEERRLWEHYGR